MELIEKDWYKSLIDDCKSLITEVHFNANWTLVQGYHSLGVRILQDYDNFKRAKIYGENIVARIAESLGKSPSTVWRAIQFAKKYPNLNELPDGKDTTWYKICNKYLTDGKVKVEHKKYVTCPFCNKEFQI